MIKEPKVHPAPTESNMAPGSWQFKLKMITLAILVIFFTYFIVVSVFFFKSFKSERNPLSSYKEIRQALENGDRLRLIMNYENSDMFLNGNPIVSPEEGSGFDIFNYQLVARSTLNNPKAYITSSFTVLVNHGRYGIIWNYGKLHIYEDNTFELNSLYFKPPVVISA